MNLQNIPRKDKVIKRGFIPKQDAFLFFDYKSIEPRLLAYYLAVTPGIEDSRLADAIVAGTDPYLAILREYFGKEDLTEEERQEGKMLFLSLMYGGGLKTVMAQQKVDKKRAWNMIDQFHEAWPGVKRLNAMLDETHQRRGYIRVLGGRPLRPESPHKGVNCLIQGSAAYLMRRALITVHEALTPYQTHIVNTIHDELMLDAIEEEIPSVVELVPPLMRVEEVHAVVPIDVDTEISFTSWAEKEEYVPAERREQAGVGSPVERREAPALVGFP